MGAPQMSASGLFGSLVEPSRAGIRMTGALGRDIFKVTNCDGCRHSATLCREARLASGSLGAQISPQNQAEMPEFKIGHSISKSVNSRPKLRGRPETIARGRAA